MSWGRSRTLGERRCLTNVASAVTEPSQSSSRSPAAPSNTELFDQPTQRDLVRKPGLAFFGRQLLSQGFAVGLRQPPVLRIAAQVQGSTDRLHIPVDAFQKTLVPLAMRRQAMALPDAKRELHGGRHASPQARRRRRCSRPNSGRTRRAGNRWRSRASGSCVDAHQVQGSRGSGSGQKLMRAGRYLPNG